MPLERALDLAGGQVPHATSCGKVVWEGCRAQISHHFGAAYNRQQTATHRTVLSPEPDTKALPFGLMATLYTLCPICPCSVLSILPDARSHTLARVGRPCGRVSEPKLVITLRQQTTISEVTHRTVLSKPDTMVFPSGLMATLYTPLRSYPCSVLLTLPDAKSHTLHHVGRTCGKGSEPKLVMTTRQITVSRKWTHRTVSSFEPDTMVLSSRTGLKATLYTMPVCPCNVFMTSPDVRPHTLRRVGRSCWRVQSRN